MNRSVWACAALVLVTACGGGATSGGKDEPQQPAAPVVFDESQVVRHLHLKNDTYVAPNGQQCDVAAVLTSANDVSTYADAGDAVATNPDGTAGVKIVGAEKATCLHLLTSALADFPNATEKSAAGQ